MKFIQEIKEQYEYLWWWLLTQGIIVATFIVEFFFLSIFAIAMAILYFFLKWMSRH